MKKIRIIVNKDSIKVQKDPNQENPDSYLKKNKKDSNEKKLSKMHTEEKLEILEKNIREKILKEGYEKGFQKGEKQGHKNGYDKGFQEGCETVNNFITALSKTEKNLKKEIGTIFSKIESEIISLNVKIVEQLLLTNIKENNYHIEKIVNNALGELNLNSYVNVKEIHCNPQDFLILKHKFDTIEIIQNQQITKGDCIIKTNIGEVEVSLKERIKQLKKLFAENAA